MLSSPGQSKRRFSDQTLAMNIKPANQTEDARETKRRQTIGGDVRRQVSSTTAVATMATILPTPTKQKVSLGSTAASAYYFSGLPKTPFTQLKRPKGGADGHNCEILDGDDSTASTGASDVMNKSVLSDTTELTASTFVRAATSRLQVMESVNFGKDNTLQSDTQPDVVTVSLVMPKSETKGSTSPSSSLRKLTQTLKNVDNSRTINTCSKSPHDQSTSMLLFLSPMSKQIHSNVQKSIIYDSNSSGVDVSISSLHDLFDGLLDVRPAQSPDSSLLASPNSRSDQSLQSLPTSSSTTPVTNSVLDSFVSPGKSPITTVAACESEKSSSFTPIRSHSKLTPTKLNPSPRRVVNLNNADSPARNTRSAIKNASTDSDKALGSDGKTRRGSRSPNIPSPPDRQRFNMNVTISPDNKSRSSVEYQPAEIGSKKKKRSRSSDVEISKNQIRSRYNPDILQPVEEKSQSHDGGADMVSKYHSDILQQTKSEHAGPPRSILNSALKKAKGPDSLTRKTVAFGSPEAAEYHIGSPSVSLTPMPSTRAKALFSIPRYFDTCDHKSSSSSDSSTSAMNEDETQTVAIEVDISQVLHNISQYHEQDSTTMNLGIATDSLSSSLELNLSADPSAQKFTIQNASQCNELDPQNLGSTSDALCPSPESKSFAESSSQENTSKNPSHCDPSDITKLGLFETSEPSSPSFESKSFILKSSQEKTIQMDSSINDVIERGTFVDGLSDRSTVDDFNKVAFVQVANTVELENTLLSVLKASVIEDSLVDFRDTSHFNHRSVDDVSAIVSAKTIEENASTNVRKRETTSAEETTAQLSDVCDEDNTVALEDNLSAILAMASHGSDDCESIPALKLTDRFPETLGTLPPFTNRMSLVQPSGTLFVDHEENNTSSRFDIGLFESPASTCTRHTQSISSSRRFSLAKPSRLSIASIGSLASLSRTEEISRSDLTEECAQSCGRSYSKQIEHAFTITNQEVIHIVGQNGYLPVTPFNKGFQSAVQSLCQPGNVAYSQISDSILSFAIAVCGEVEEKAGSSSDSETCFRDLLENIEEGKHSLQCWIRDEVGENHIKSIAFAIRSILEHEWGSWEKVVLDSLVAAIEQIGIEFEPENSHLDRCLNTLNDINETLSIAAGKAARKARRRSMARHKVSMRLVINKHWKLLPHSIFHVEKCTALVV